MFQSLSLDVHAERGGTRTLYHFAPLCRLVFDLDRPGTQDPPKGSLIFPPSVKRKKSTSLLVHPSIPLACSALPLFAGAWIPPNTQSPSHNHLCLLTRARAKQSAGSFCFFPSFPFCVFLPFHPTLCPRDESTTKQPLYPHFSIVDPFVFRLSITQFHSNPHFFFHRC